MEMRTNGLPQAEGFALLKAIHRCLFQDIYDWVGQPRTTALFKAEFEGSPLGTSFVPPNHIDREGKEIFRSLAAENNLQGLDRADFIDPLAHYFNRVNILHAFREGNGRTQRILWEHVAEIAGFALDFQGITRERMVAVCIAGGQGSEEPLQRMFVALLDSE